jgi:septum formation protein
MPAQQPLILASASSRRVELLSHLVCNFDKIPANIDETIYAHETPYEYVSRLAKEKARKIYEVNTHAAVLGSDTIVVIDGLILGKPENIRDSKEMLDKLSGRWHKVMTAVSIHYKDDAQENKALSCLVITDVEFCQLTESEISHYWQTQEPCDKAGSYAIQGIGGKFVKQIKGSYSSVVGLPLVETKELLKQIGIIT